MKTTPHAAAAPNGGLLLLAVMLAGCPGGLPLEYGNAFPCDFSLPEPDRDAPCRSLHEGEWVCGIDNVCRPFANEGLQEETPPLDLDAGFLAQPRVFRGPIQAVAADPGRNTRMLVVHGDELQWVHAGRLRVTPVDTSALTLPGPIDELALATSTAGDEVLAVVRSEGVAITGELRGDAGFRLSSPQPVTTPAGVLVTGVSALRTDETRAPLAPLASPLILRLADGGAGDALRRPAPPPQYRYDPFAVPGAVLDARAVQRRLVETVELDGGAFLPRVAIAFTQDGIHYREQRPLDGGAETWLRLDDGSAPVAAGNVDPVVRHNRDATLWALKYRRADGREVLGTWRLERGNPPRMTRAWTDCAPCGSGGIAELTPVDGPLAGVEVLCGALFAGDAGATALVHVSGATTAVSGDPCDQAELVPPFDLAEVLPVFDRSAGQFVTFGGRHGQLWSGRQLSAVLPLSLDRVPSSAGTFKGAATAITDHYLAIPAEGGNGTVAAPLEALADAVGIQGKKPSALVAHADGWLLLDSADLLRLVENPAGDEEAPLLGTFGPRLESASGEPPPPPYLAEGLTYADGGLRILVAAGDSLYDHVVGPTTARPDQLEPELPHLTLEPGFRIRSLTLDHATPVRPGSNVAVRGFAVTSRNVFQFELGGAPERWSATQIPVPLGEPVKVWMAQRGSDLGRVAFRDGTVFTLPGGYPMAEKLPEVPGLGVPRVIDFANLNGWPVALTEVGLFVTARNPQPFPDGGVSRILVWRRVELPPELRNQPRRLREGRLEVLPEAIPGGGEHQVLYLFTEWGFVYRLAASRSR